MKLRKGIGIILGTLAIGALLGATAGLGGCGKKDEAEGASGGTGSASGKSDGGAKPLVVFAQANSADPWRQVFDAEIKAAAEKHGSEFSFEMQAAEDDANKQMGIVDTYMVKNPKAMLISPTDVAVTQSVEKVFDKGVPVILLDRAIDSQKFTCWIGGDNMQIGREAGEYLGKSLGGKGTILMVQGLSGATPTNERKNGALEVLKSKYPGITVIEGDNCDYQRQKARDYMQTFLQSGKTFDAVYAHNDEMAIGAYLAMEAAGMKGKIIVGIDACQQEIVDYIKSGKVTATFKYPTPGARGIEVAADILKGNAPKEKRIVLPTVLVTKDSADQYLKDNPNLAK